MRIFLIAVGTRMPTWVNRGFEEYAGRLPRECHLALIPISPSKRSKNVELGRLLQEEGKRVLAAVPANTRVIALDQAGRPWNTLQLAQQLDDWLQDGRDMALLVGGPEGLDRACKVRAEALWSLSPLTFPHPLVRIIVAEQLYRAWSLLHNHPYHRA